MSYGQGVIDVRRTKDGRERHRVRVPNGSGKYLTIGTYDSAKEAEAMRAAGLVAREEIGIGSTLEQWGEAEWLPSIASQKGARTVRSTWSSIIADAPFYRIALDELTKPEIKAWVASLPQKRCKRSVIQDGKRVTVEIDRTLSPQMVKHALQKLTLCLDAAVDKGLISANPARGVKLPRFEQIEDGWTYLRPKEIAAVLALDLTPLQRAVFGLAIYTGARVGELACLRWDCVVDLDGDYPVLELRRSYRGGTKGGRPRKIDAFPMAAEVLRAWQPDPRRRKGLVFPGPSGEPYSEQHRWGWDERYNGRTDIPTAAGIERRVTFHALRHTCASMLVSGEWTDEPWPLQAVRDYLGHRSIKTTERYAHLHEAALRRLAARAKLSANLSTPKPPRAQASVTAVLSKYSARSCADSCKANDSSHLDASGQVLDGFGLARSVQDLVAAGKPVPVELVEALVTAGLESSRAGRTVVAFLRASTDAARLSWLLDLADQLAETTPQLERARRAR